MGTGSGHVKDERRGYVRVETQRLLIRDVAAEDKMPFVEMAADGSLKDMGFDKNCSSWMSEWIDEAKEVASGYECGIGLAGFNDIKIGDIIEAFILKEEER